MRTSRSRLLFLLAATAITFVPLVLLPQEGPALPMQWGGTPTDSVSSPRWADSTTIKIYIPHHPTDSTAAACVAEGLQRWAAQLATRGITIQVNPGQSPPPGATNAVGVEWVPNGSLGGGREGYANPRTDGAKPKEKIVSGTIKLEDDNTCTEYEVFLKNLAMHELGHILGLADEVTKPGQQQNAMDPTIPVDDPVTLSPRDVKEFESLYAFVDGTHAQGIVDDEAFADGPGWSYLYTVTWTGGPEIPIFELAIGADPAGVVPSFIPPGWELAWPPVYYDVEPGVPAYPSTRKLHFRCIDGGLSAMNPVATFGLHSVHPPAAGWAHAMIDMDDDGEFDFLPAAVPTSAATGLPGEEMAGLRFHALAPVPNPFKGATVLRFASAAGGSIRLEIFDTAGRLRRILDRPISGPGILELAWDGNDGHGVPVPPGIYFARGTQGIYEGSVRLVRLAR